eukprot:m.310962 g.310962  ORF g.310962 m.310962 type:complete len:50 (+) comp57069_c0_seq1:4048-4197(+)
MALLQFLLICECFNFLTLTYLIINSSGKWNVQQLFCTTVKIEKLSTARR